MCQLSGNGILESCNMSNRPAETVSDGLRVAVRMIKEDAYD